MAVGREAEVEGDYGVSIGYNTRSAQDGTAVGEQARSKKQGATALGVSSRGYSQGGVAIGWQSLAGANVYTAGVPGSDINKDNATDITNYAKWGDVAIGLRAMATGGNATAVGRSANATEANAIAIGGGDGNASNDNVEHTIASGEKAIAIGYKALASDKNATSIGTDAQARQSRATAIGYEVRAVGKNAVAIGSSGENSSRKLNSAGENAVAIGTAAQANNLGSTAIGNLALASNNNAIALGTSAEGTGASSTAIGNNAQATKTNAIALGTEAEASEAQTVAIGKGATAEKTDAVALGTSATSGGVNGVAIGNDAQAKAADTIAVGSTSRAETANDNAFGNSANASGGGSTAVGYMVTTSGNQAFGAGSNSKVSGAGAVGIGYKVTASGNRSISIGNDNGNTQTEASGEKAIAIGSGVQSKGSASIAMGKNTYALKDESVAIGSSVSAVGSATGSTVIGSNSTTNAERSVSLGSSISTSAAATYSTGIGYQVNVSGKNGIAIGSSDGSAKYVTAGGENAIAVGTSAQATGKTSTAIGKDAVANQENAFAAGKEAKAQATDTVAIGSGVTASGLQSISIGSTFNNRANQATGIASVAIGSGAQSTGAGSVALGRNVQALEKYTTAVGMNITASDSASASTILGYNSSTKANQSVNIVSTNTTEKSAQYSTAIGYQINVSGKNAIGIGSSDDKQNVVASAYNAAAIGTSAQATAESAMALGTNANAALAHSVALGEGSTTTAADGAGKTAYLSGEASNNTGNGVISVGNKRNASDAGTITRRIVSVAGGTDDYDAVNVNQLKALEKNEWLLRTQNAGDANPTDVAPQTVNNQTKKRVTLKGGDNLSISNTNGVVTLNVTNVVKSVATDNTNALDISNTNGAVKINPKLATSVDAAGEANKLVTAGTVKTALDLKVNKADELHVKPGNYTVQSSGDVSLIQENANSQTQGDKGFTIKDVAKKSVVDTLQSDFNTFKAKAITFTGDDNQGVARTLDTTLTVKGGANYTSTTVNTNIRVEKDGTTGLAVKLSDQLTGMKEIAGTGTQDLVIKSGNTTVTVKAPANGDKGTVDFGDAKVVASNLDASIKYRANDEAVAKAKSVKLADGFNFVASNVTDTATEGPKSGLAIKAEDNGKVTFGLDKATRNTIDNAADKNLSNLTQDGKNKVTELAKIAAKEAVKVAPGHNTTVATDTSTAGVTTYTVHANDTTVAAGSEALTINNATPDTNKVRAYTVDLSAATKGKLAAVGNLANVIGGTSIAADGRVTGPTFSITNAAGTAENAGTIKEAIEKLDAANKGQNTKINDTAEKVTTLDGKVSGIVEKGMVFAGDDAAADKVTRKLGETLNIHGQNNISVKKDGTSADTLNVKLASELKNITSISSGDGTTGSIVTLGADGVSIANTKDGATKTVTIGKDGINAGGMKITNVAEATENGDAANKKYVDDAISNLGNIVSGNATLNFAGNVTKDKQNQDTAKVGLSLATGTLHVNGANNEITTTAKGDTITVGLAETVKAQLAKVGDTSSNGRDGKDGTSGAQGLTGKDGLNDKTLTEKVNALRNGEAGSVVYTDENGTRLVKAKDGEYYKAADVDATGNVLNGATKATTVEARVVNPDGTTTGGTTKLSNIADGKVAAGSKDAVNGGQLHTAKSEIGAIIGGTTINENGKITGPTFSITNEAGTAENAGTIKEAVEKLDAANKGQNTKISENTEKLTKLGETVTTNYNDLSKKITDGATNITNTLTTKGLDFTGNDITDAGKLHRDLGTTLTIKGTENFTRAATENNIKVVKNGDALDVKLAENLANMKEISGNGKDNLVIKNGDATITLKPKKEAEGTNPATPATVDFGETKVVASNLDANISYKAGNEDTKKKVKLQDGFNFTAATDTTVTAEGPKAGLAITAEDNGKVTFGLDKATRSTIDNAADKDLSNLTDTGKNTVKELAKGAVKVAEGINTTVTTDTTTAGVTTYKVNANDTTVAVNADTLAISGGDLDATTKVRAYTLDLSNTVKAKLNAINNVGDTASNGRDGVNGASGAKGLTGKDGLNDKTLTDKVNALRNGEAGSVVYTNEAGDRVVKAKDGEYYKATDVDATGNVLNGAKPAATVEARVVNPKGETTVPTKLSNIADGKVAANSKDAVNGGQLHTAKSEIGAIIGGTTINENGKITGPTFSITNAAGTKDDATTIKDAIEKLDATNAAQNTKISETTEKLTNLGDTVTNNYNDLSKKITDGSTNITNTLTTKGLDFTGNDITAKVHRDLGTTLTIKGADNFTRTATETNNIKVVKTDNDLDVKLAENLGNIKSISNATGAGKPGSTITLGADGVSIANTAAGQDGAAGTTKTVTIGKDGINAGGMKVTNVAKAEADGDAANKAYVDDAIKNLNTTVTNNANLRYAGDTNEGTVNGEDHLNLPLATGTLKVAGTSDQIKTVANNGTITLSLAEKVTNKLDKLGDTAADGRDGKAANGQAGDAGNAGDKGATGKDGLNGTNLTDKVNALRNGEAGSVVYTDENGERLVKANNGNYYKTTDVDKTGNVVNNAQPATTVEARVVNPDGTTTGGTTKLSNIADGKVAANSKDAVNGGQLHTAKSEIGAIIGGTTINENGKITVPTFSITNADGNAENAGTIKEAIEKLDAANKGQNTKISETAGKVTTLEGKVDGIVEKGMVFAGDDAAADKVTRKLGETLNIHGQNNITVKKDGTAVDTLNVKLASDLKNITSITNADADGKPGSKITLDANGVSIANTAAGQDGAAGTTKTVTIGKDGINAGGMTITNVGEAKAEGDAANKKYVDDAINNLNTTVTNNANLRYAGDTNEGAVNGEDHLNLPLATGTLKVAGTADQIKTVANNGTITLSLDEKVTNKLNKLGDTASNGRDGANGLTGKDGLNDKTLTEKVNALRNGEAGTVVYTDDAGERLVKANDGKYYHKDDLKADGTPKTADENNGTAPKAVDNPQARVVNPNGDAKAPTTLSNIADGKVAEGSKDAVNGGQLHTVKSDLATALGGGAKVENGVFTGPTYSVTKADGTGTETASNVGEAISKLDTRITTANGALVTKGLDFTGNDTTAKVHRNLGETLTIKGAENFTRTATETNNIKVVKTGNDLDVKLAENLGNMKEIAGNGTDDLVIKNGDATITLKPKKDAEGTNPATPATVDFGDTKVVASNLDASIKYRANDEGAANAKSVKLADGFNFVASTVTDTATEGPKSGLAIKAEDNGKVTFGLDKATREKVDNAADKNLSNLSQDGKDKVKELAGEAAKAAVTVADGINTTVTTDTTTTAGITTYKVNANDTTVAVNADTLAISGGTPDATTKVRAYTLDLSDTVKAKLNAINNVGDTASNGRDGVNGTSGATGLTGADGLNNKTLTEKVNALRNGEAGSVVYTNEAGDRVVKAKDGEYYKATDVDKDGNVLNGATPASTVEARLVNPKGETTVPTKLSNIADGKVAANSKDAVNGGQLNTVKSDLATALGGDAKVENGVFTGPTYNITKDDGSNKTESVNNVGDAISKLDGRINNANTTLANKGLDFTGNDTTDAGKVHRNLGETLTIKGAENFTRTDAETNNIKVVKNNNDLDVKLAENLGNIKEIAGNGKDDLVIKNGDATITLKPKKEAEGTNPATPATVDFGNTKVVAPNLEASITYRANSAEDADAKTVTLQKGLNFVSGDGTAATAEAAKAGITIAADKDGKVVFGLNETTRNAIDNAADKNLNNLSQEGKDKVADLAKTAAREAVKVTGGNNVTVTPETKDGVTTYTVNGRDTTVKAADKGSVSVTGGALNANGEREYTVDLTADAKAELGKISDLNTRLGSAEGKITTLQGDMTKAKDDIAANTKAIEANKEAIATNKNAIADNARDIAANRKDIYANKQGIAENKKQIGENTAAIGKNADNIKKNAQDIKKNEDAIKSNTDRIHTVETRVDTAEGKIAANEKAIKDNASAIQSNTKAIGTNTTAIAKNASDITKANKEIESLKGNSATKDLSNLTNAGKDTITKLIDVKGENGITVTPSTNTDSRVKTFTAKLNDTVTFGSGDKKITVDGTTGTVTSKAVAADTVKANTVNAKTVKLGDSTGTNTTVTADGIAVTTKNPDGTTSKVEIKNGTVSGLTNTKWDPAKVVTDADRSVVATQGQVKDVTDTLARGRVFVGDTGKTVTVGLGDTLAIKGGSTKALTDDNIGVVSTEAKDGKPATMTVKLAKDVKMKDGSTSYDYYLPEVKTNPDGSKEIVKNADGSVKYQLGKDGNPIRLVTTTVNGEGITIAPVKGLDKPTVSLTADGLDNGGNQIHNVAAGTANTDAATVGQVRAAAHALNNRVNEAGAHAAALAAMNPLSYDPLKKSQVMAGYGAYKGSNALALGVAHYANEDTLFNVGVSVGNGENMVNAGVTYRFGGEDSMIPERYKGGPISSVYVMQDEISALKAENARKDAENAKKEAENEEMKAQIKMLIERVTMLEAKK